MVKDGFWREPERAQRVDILADERNTQKRKRKRRLFSKWHDLMSGRSGLFVLGGFLLVGLVAVVFQQVIGEDAPGISSYGAGAQQVHSESGRDLTPLEAADGLRYGRPLYLGDSGRPVVVLNATGEVRELTPVELEFPVNRHFVSTGYGRAVWSPGARGLGVWWNHDPELWLVSEAQYFDRLTWVNRQTGELQGMVSGLSPILLFVAGMDLNVWQPGWGELLAGRLTLLRDPYELATFYQWGAIPDQWRCSDELESDLNQGVTRGCPTGEYTNTLSAVWVELGNVMEILAGLGRLGDVRDGQTLDVAIYSGLYAAQAHRTLDLYNAVDRLEVALGILHDVSAAERLSIGVELFVD